MRSVEPTRSVKRTVTVRLARPAGTSRRVGPPTATATGSFDPRTRRRLRFCRLFANPSSRNPMNTVALIGRLTADPDVRAGEKHESASFRLAVPRRSVDKDTADFIDIVTFDTLAATCGEYLTKGRQVAVAPPHRSRRFVRGPRKPAGSA